MKHTDETPLFPLPSRERAERECPGRRPSSLYPLLHGKMTPRQRQGSSHETSPRKGGMGGGDILHPETRKYPTPLGGKLFHPTCHIVHGGGGGCEEMRENDEETCGRQPGRRGGARTGLGTGKGGVGVDCVWGRRCREGGGVGVVSSRVAPFRVTIGTDGGLF